MPSFLSASQPLRGANCPANAPIEDQYGSCCDRAHLGYENGWVCCSKPFDRLTGACSSTLSAASLRGGSPVRGGCGASEMQVNGNCCAYANIGWINQNGEGTFVCCD